MSALKNTDNITNDDTDDLDVSDDLTERLEAAKREHTNACDDLEAYRRVYLEDPCDYTKGRYVAARKRCAEAWDAYQEVVAQFDAWESEGGSWEED